MTYSFGFSSMTRKLTCHKDLQLILDQAIKVFDFSILEGSRDLETQKFYYKTGRSKLDGVTERSKHQTSKEHPYSLAADIAPYPIDFEDRERFFFLAGVMKGVANKFLEDGKISHRLRWGGDWNNNNDFNDQDFNDLVHFELYN